MVHRAKCNGEIIYVASGRIRDALALYSPTDSDSAERVRQELSRTRFNRPDMPEIERTFSEAGYLDFDQLNGDVLPAVGHYFDLVFGGKRTTLCGVRIIGEKTLQKQARPE